MTPESIGAVVFYTAILGFSCWLYYSTILPSARYCLRLTLFRLRDKLRQLVIDGKLRHDDEAFVILDADLSSMISGVSRFDLSAAMQRIPEVQRQAVLEFIHKRHEILCREDLPELRAIDVQAMKTLALAFALNSLVVGPVVFPLMVVAHVIRTGAKNLRSALYEWTTLALSVEEDSAFQRMRVV